MYKTHAKIKWCLSCCPLYGGCPHLGGSVKGGSTVYMYVCTYMYTKENRLLVISSLGEQIGTYIVTVPGRGYLKQLQSWQPLPKGKGHLYTHPIMLPM